MAQSQCGSSNIPVSEVYWTLADKANKKFSKIRDLPYYQRNRCDTYFYKVFKVYTQLWKFQQENRQKLVEAGLKRWEIGEIASRIAQLYFGQYMRTSEASYLLESYVFYEAILSREYFREGLFDDLNLANKQLRFLARFLMVCLILNRQEMVHQLVNQLKILLEECKRTFQDTDFKEWKLGVKEIVRFLKADTAFITIRPLRYSLILDPPPDSLPHTTSSRAKRHLRLRDAILSSFHQNEIKFSELTLDTFRMIQCLEWEPSGSFYKSNGSKLGESGAPEPSHVSFSQDISDPTLPPNPRKAILYRPSVTQFIAVLATTCEELPPDGVLLIYLSASGVEASENFARDLQFHANSSDVTASFSLSLKSDSLNPCRQSSNKFMSHPTGCLQFDGHGAKGVNCIYPSDLIPFTRRPLFLVIDSDSSMAFKAIDGREIGEPAGLLLSPNSSPPLDSSRHQSGSLFTLFLTAPLQAFCTLIGVSGSDVNMYTYGLAEKCLSSAINDWGVTLAASDTLDSVWAQVLSDPFLRRLLLRFVFCRAGLALYGPTFNKQEFLPQCLPALPVSLSPETMELQSAILQLATIFGAADSFIFSEN